MRLNIVDWDYFKIQILQEILRTQNQQHSCHPDRWKKCFSTFLTLSASVFQWPIAVFLFVELLLTFSTRSVATNDRFLMFFEFLSAMPRTTCIRLKVFPFNFVNCVKRVHGSDRSPATINVHPVSCSSASSRQCIGNASSFGTEFNSWFNVMTIHVISCVRPRIVSGFTVHPLACLMVETRPTLLEDIIVMLFASCKVIQIEVDLWKTWSLPDNSGIWNVHHFSAWGPLSHWVFEREILTRPKFPVPQCLQPWCLRSRFTPHFFT